MIDTLPYLIFYGLAIGSVLWPFYTTFLRRAPSYYCEDLILAKVRYNYFKE